MKYVTHIQDPDINTTGAALKGIIRVPFKTLVSAFGQPLLTLSGGARWKIRFETVKLPSKEKEHIVALISNRLTPRGTLPEDNEEWLVNAYDARALAMVHDALKPHMSTTMAN